MNHGCVTLDEVFAAATVRAASLVPETSGYLALAVCDATSRLPVAVDDRVVMLTTEGNVGITKRGEVIAPAQAAANLRALLARLLDVSTGTAMPSLTAAARAPQKGEEPERGVEAVIEEIEAALIPVNRAAARRALARLARETIKARESGRLRRASTRPAPLPKPASVAPAGAVAASPADPPAAPPPPAPVAPALVAPASVAPALVAPASVAPVAPVAATPLPAHAAPPPVVPAPPTSSPDAEHVASHGLTPPPVVHEPTPTVLGTAFETAVDLSPAPAVPPEGSYVETPTVALHLGRSSEPEAAPPTDATTSPDSIARLEDSPAPAAEAPASASTLRGMGAPPPIAVSALPDMAPGDEPEPTGLPESTVLAQPTEDPHLAFALEPPPVARSITPAYAFDVGRARQIPAARIVSEPRVVACATPEGGSTRADDLLARFGASCADDEGMRNAAACLRRIAGVDPTPPPPARVEIRVQEPPAPAQQRGLVALPPDWWTSEETRRIPRRRSGSARVLLPLAALVVGLAGGAGVVRFRPDLVAAVMRSPAQDEVPPPAQKPVEKKEAAPQPQPPATEPAGAIAPSWSERLGGTRAERGSAERSR